MNVYTLAHLIPPGARPFVRGDLIAAMKSFLSWPGLFTRAVRVLAQPLCSTRVRHSLLSFICLAFGTDDYLIVCLICACRRVILDFVRHSRRGHLGLTGG